MNFEIRIKKKALKFISSLKKDEKNKIGKIFLALKSEPVPVKKVDVAKIKGMDNVYRIRVGKIRIVYEVLWNEKVIIVHRVDFRKRVYKRE